MCQILCWLTEITSYYLIAEIWKVLFTFWWTENGKVCLIVYFLVTVLKNIFFATVSEFKNFGNVSDFMLIHTNQKIYFESRNLKSMSDCLLFETVLKNIMFETIAEF